VERPKETGANSPTLSLQRSNMRVRAGYYCKPTPVQSDGHSTGTLFTQPKVLAPSKALLECCFLWWSDGLRLNEEELSSPKITKRPVAGRVRTLSDHDLSLITSQGWRDQVWFLGWPSLPVCLYCNYPLNCLVEKTSELHRFSPSLCLPSD
jgi:hypothetical protein